MTGHLSFDGLEALIREFEASGVRELHLRSPDIDFYLSKDAAASSPPIFAPASAAPGTAPRADAKSPEVQPATPMAEVRMEAAAGASIVTAPNLGTFYRSPKPGAAPYVNVGDRVAVGDEICLIEVMKLFTAVRCDVAGIVQAVLAGDAEMVEAGAPLFAIVVD